MNRREFVRLLAGSAAMSPVLARAQHDNRPVKIGFVPMGSPGNAYDRSLVEAFREGLSQVRLVENRDVVLDVAWTTGNPDETVAKVLKGGAELLIPCGSSASVAARLQTTTIPIVFLSVGDPIAMGLVDSLARPGRNATGFSDILADLSGKLVDIARELNGPRDTLEYVWHTAWPDGKNRHDATERAASAGHLKLRSRGIADIAELDETLAAVKQAGSRFVVIQPSPFTYTQRDKIIRSAFKNDLGTIFGFPVAAREGSLVAYGPDYLHMYRRASLYVERVLKGTKPADLPVEQPTKVEFLINLKTAKTLAFEPPLSMLIRADELIE
jgi:putative ABC transport system substrate-binding protein